MTRSPTHRHGAVRGALPARLAAVTFTASLMVLGPGCGDGALCDREEVVAALADASPGETVSLGACVVAAPLTIPAGVTLAGQGRDTVVRVMAAGSGVEMIGGNGTTTLRDLSIESAGRFAVRATGTAAALRIEDVAMRLEAGMGLDVTGARALEVRRTTIDGPITFEVAATLPADPDPAITATHGIVLDGLLTTLAAPAVIDRVEVRGLAAFGLLSIDSFVQLQDASFSDNRGVGVMIHGGGASMQIVGVHSTYGGNAASAFGVVFSGETTVTSEALAVSATFGYGILQDGASTSHRGLVVADNVEIGIWLQGFGSMGIEGAGSVLRDNGLANVIAVDSGRLMIAECGMEGARLSSRAVDGEPVEIGDGLQIVDAVGPIDLRSLGIRDNERVGLLIEGSWPSAVSISDVEVDARGDALGAIVHGGAPPDGWDRGISRRGTAEANDASFTDELAVVVAIGATELPAAAR